LAANSLPAEGLEHVVVHDEVDFLDRVIEERQRKHRDLGNERRDARERAARELDAAAAQRGEGRLLRAGFAADQQAHVVAGQFALDPGLELEPEHLVDGLRQREPAGVHDALARPVARAGRREQRGRRGGEALEETAAVHRVV
jgi:hypothetical protein